MIIASNVDGLVTKHWLSAKIIQLFIPESFKLCSFYCCDWDVQGGVMIYLKPSTVFEELNYLNSLAIPRVCELTAGSLTAMSSYIIINATYKTPFYK